MAAGTFFCCYMMGVVNFGYTLQKYWIYDARVAKSQQRGIDQLKQNYKFCNV